MQFLAILKVKTGMTRETLGPLLQPEAAKAWEMLASGALRSIHYIKGPVGAVLLFEADAEQEVAAHVAGLPLVEQGVVSVEILALTPFTGFASLFASQTV